ncbi:MAG: DUF1592 domain-containing protein [Minicystis sp.]
MKSLSSRSLILSATLLGASIAACTGDGNGNGQTGGGGMGGGCPDDPAYFAASVDKPIFAVRCVSCHVDGGLAKDSRFVLVPGDEQASFEVARKVAAIVENGEPILLSRPSGRHPDGHPGGTLAPVGSADYATLGTFIGRVTKGQGCDEAPASCGAPEPGRRLLRRLSRAEYDRTVDDLFGFTQNNGASFTADTVVEGYDNNADALLVTPLLAEQLRKAAEAIAATALAEKPGIVPCPLTSGDAACATKLIETFGKRAYRRPVDAGESARLGSLFTKVSAAEGFAAGIEAVIAAMLQSPSFLYRTELGAHQGKGEYRLTGWEVASELSYLLWGTMPDDALFTAAESGALDTPAGIAKEVDRLLADPRSDEIVARFVEAWLGLDRLANVPKDATVYPTFDAAIRDAMKGELTRFVRGVVRDGTGSLKELFTTRTTYVNDTLADFYGLPKPGSPADAEGYHETSLEGTGRGGLITLGAVLATFAHPNESSPIHRGKFVRERLLCQPLQPPPPSVNASPPPFDPTLTTRERFAAHAKNEPCKSCHQLIDPIGFGFEHFDGVGRHRADDNGLPIDASGEILNSAHTDGAFDGTDALAEKLAESVDVRACFARQWIRFGYGVKEDHALGCFADGIALDVGSGGSDVRQVIAALTGAPWFTRRIGEIVDDPGTGTGGGGAGGSGGAGASSSSGGPVGQDLVVTTNVDSQWPTGACKSVTVANETDMAITWSVPLDPGGALTNVWNATASGMGAATVFVGVDYNKTLAAKASTSFGFCVSF